MIQAGLYAAGSDPATDRAIRLQPGLGRLFETLLEASLEHDPHVDTVGGIAARWRRREAYRRGELP